MKHADFGPISDPKSAPTQKIEPKKGAPGPNTKSASWRRFNGPITPLDRHLFAYDPELQEV